jgi:hypothetical protein
MSNIPEPAVNAMPAQELSSEQEEAAALLKHYGVLPAKAVSLVCSLGPEVVTDTVEYLASSALGGRRKIVENPAGLIIYSLEKEMPIPADFMSSRKKRVQEEARNKQSRVEGERMLEQLAYAEWLDDERERLVAG